MATLPSLSNSQPRMARTQVISHACSQKPTPPPRQQVDVQQPKFSPYCSAPPSHVATQAALCLGLTATSVALSSHPAWNAMIAGSHLSSTTATLMYVNYLRSRGVFGSFGIFAPEFYWLTQTVGIACSGALLSAMWGIAGHLG